MVGDNNDMTVVICFTIFFLSLINVNTVAILSGIFLLYTPHTIPITYIVISFRPPRLNSRYYNNNDTKQ